MLSHGQGRLLYEPRVHQPDKTEAYYGRADLAVLWYHQWRRGMRGCKTAYCQVSEPCETAVVKILWCHPGHRQISSLIFSAKHTDLEMLWMLFRSGATLGSGEHLEVPWGALRNESLDHHHLISISSSKTRKVCRRRDAFITVCLHPLRQSSDRGWLCAKASWSLVCGDRHPRVTSMLQLGQSWAQQWG